MADEFGRNADAEGRENGGGNGYREGDEGGSPRDAPADARADSPAEAREVEERPSPRDQRNDEGGRSPDDRRDAGDRDRDVSPADRRDEPERDDERRPGSEMRDSAERGPRDPDERRSSPPRRDFDGEPINLFVRNVARMVTNDELEALFAKFGKVSSAVAVRDPHTQECRGFGFVKMETEEGAVAAMEGLADYEFAGRRMVVERAKRSGPHERTPGAYMGVDRTIRERYAGIKRTRDFDDRGSGPGGYSDRGGYGGGRGGDRWDERGGYGGGGQSRGGYGGYDGGYGDGDRRYPPRPAHGGYDGSRGRVEERPSYDDRDRYTSRRRYDDPPGRAYDQRPGAGGSGGGDLPRDRESSAARDGGSDFGRSRR